ncbi:ribosomal-protein-alanine N-acetyltransferase [Pseudarthrobacter defluvii]|uniref:GNAT family N-acetyltransferase n=1 Tax=Pseudarthrobacter defluvii TaxID=410837 RepID=UPI00277F20F0|nr:GNAT family N-acetyltransferase [Pseudarthrobacter defluvii]MDQ0770639.1 ribosomal-protein-alanine N-acetyltransferase [Pseudarthrobacter defluvii]
MDFARELAGGIVLRPVLRSDAGPLARAFQANRSHLAPWEPVRNEEFYTVEGQRQVIERRRAELEAGTSLPLVLAGREDIVGLLTLNSIVRGAFQNAHVRYWISREVQGAGVMTAAVAAAVDLAGNGLCLHRLEAATLLHNKASQRVLEKNGFEAYGTAAAYLRIAGRWQDHRMHQRIL